MKGCTVVANFYSLHRRRAKSCVEGVRMEQRPRHQESKRWAHHRSVTEGLLSSWMQGIGHRSLNPLIDLWNPECSTKFLEGFYLPNHLWPQDSCHPSSGKLSPFPDSESTLKVVTQVFCILQILVAVLSAENRQEEGVFSGVLNPRVTSELPPQTKQTGDLASEFACLTSSQLSW